jgi:predicted Zn-dependent protease
MRMPLLALAAASLTACGCQSGPFGRKHVVAVSTDQEQKLGAEAYQQVLAEEKDKVLPPDDARSRRVAEVGGRLARASETAAFRTAAGLAEAKPFEGKFAVVDDPQVNAFCLPGGKVVVYTGILPVCQTDAGLAVVLGHEVSHALARHGAERITQQALAGAGAEAASFGLSRSRLGETAQTGLMQALNAGEKYGLLAYGRGQESEADRMGLLLMAAAGYDPAEAPAFWDRMPAPGGRQVLAYASTHPAPATRIADLKRRQAEAGPLYQAGDPQPDRVLPRR